MVSTGANFLSLVLASFSILLNFMTNYERKKNCTQKGPFSCVHRYSDLDDLGPLDLVVTCGGNRENSVKSSKDTEGDVEQAQQQGPAGGHQGAHQVFHRNVLFILNLLFQILHRQRLKRIKWWQAEISFSLYLTDAFIHADVYF